MVCWMWSQRLPFGVAAFKWLWSCYVVSTETTSGRSLKIYLEDISMASLQTNTNQVSGAALPASVSFTKRTQKNNFSLNHACESEGKSHTPAACRPCPIHHLRPCQMKMRLLKIICSWDQETTWYMRSMWECRISILYPRCTIYIPSVVIYIYIILWSLFCSKTNLIQPLLWFAWRVWPGR